MESMVRMPELWNDVYITQGVQNMDYNEYVAFGVLVFTSVPESNDTVSVLSRNVEMCHA